MSLLSTVASITVGRLGAFDARCGGRPAFWRRAIRSERLDSASSSASATDPRVAMWSQMLRPVEDQPGARNLERSAAPLRYSQLARDGLFCVTVVGSPAMSDDDDLIRRLHKDAEHHSWPDVGPFSGGPRANTSPIDVKDLDRAESDSERCLSVGYVNATIGGPTIVSPPFETRCIRRSGHRGSHYAMPKRRWTRWGWWEVWAWQ